MGGHLVLMQGLEEGMGGAKSMGRQGGGLGGTGSG